VNVGVDKLAPGVFGVSHGSGMALPLPAAYPDHQIGAFLAEMIIILGRVAPIGIQGPRHRLTRGFGPEQLATRPTPRP
jgi:hypothetical protein